MDFFKYLRDALANQFESGQSNVYHASQATDAQKQQWNDDRAAAAKKAYMQDNPVSPQFRDARPDYWNTAKGSNFRNYLFEKYGDDNEYETRVYDISYTKPGSGQYMDDSKREAGSGKILVRVPKNAKSGIDGAPVVDGNIGVYQAVLDDGTVLDSDDFANFLYSNPYGSGIKWGNYVVGDNDSSIAGLNDYQTKSESEAIRKRRESGTPSATWNIRKKRWTQN